MKKIKYHCLPQLSSYKPTWDLQEILQKEIIDDKIAKKNTIDGHLIFCQHSHVYTLGRFGNENNMLLDYMKLKAKNAEFYHIDRGGDITYHGPGQLVGYPIFNLESFDIGVKEYIFKIEESIINLLKDYDIFAQRLDGATGVWLDINKKGFTRKICAIGVKVNRSVSMHGFAFNINSDLDYFNYINPCGYTDKSVTSMQKELNKKLDFELISNQLLESMKKTFGFEEI
jgi:lipoyl(octanoyl) transferase